MQDHYEKKNPLPVNPLPVNEDLSHRWSFYWRGVTQVQKIRFRNHKPQVQDAPVKLVKSGSVSHETRCARSLSIKKELQNAVAICSS